MCDILKKEFKLKNFLFGHTKPESFYTSQWRWHPLVYVVYRVVVLLYCMGWLLGVTIASIHSQDHHSVMAYLTVWTYLALCLYLLSAVATAVYCLLRQPTLADHDTVLNVRFTQGSTNKLDASATNPAFEAKQTRANSDDTCNVAFSNSIGGVEKVPVTAQHGRVSQDEERMSLCLHTLNTDWHMKLQWLLADVIYVFGPVVTAVYYTAMYPWGNSIGDAAVFAMDMNLHGVNTLIVLIDVAIVARPVRLLHFIYPIAYGLLYIIFSAIYWSEDKQGNVLYDVLDWNKPGNTCIVVALLAVATLVLHTVHFGLFRLRLFVYQNLYGTAYL